MAFDCYRSLKVIDLENTLFSKSSHRYLQICTFRFCCFCWELRNFENLEKFPTKCRRYSPFACRRTASRRYSPFRIAILFIFNDSLFIHFRLNYNFPSIFHLIPIFWHPARPCRPPTSGFRSNFVKKIVKMGFVCVWGRPRGPWRSEEGGNQFVGNSGPSQIKLQQKKNFKPWERFPTKCRRYSPFWEKRCRRYSPPVVAFPLLRVDVRPVDVIPLFEFFFVIQDLHLK